MDAGKEAELRKNTAKICVINQSGIIEPFNPGKMIQSIIDAGTSIEVATRVTRSVARRVSKEKVVSSYCLADMVSRSLAQINREASSSFRLLREKSAVDEFMVLELISEVADELSEYQDKVASESYLRTADKRPSVVRKIRIKCDSCGRLYWPARRDYSCSECKSTNYRTIITYSCENTSEDCSRRQNSRKE